MRRFFSSCHATTRLSTPGLTLRQQLFLLEEIIEIRPDVLSFHGADIKFSGASKAPKISLGPSQQLAFVPARSAANRQNFFFIQSLLGVRDTRAYLFGTDTVVARDFCFGPALCDKAQNEFHRQPRAANNGLANEHGWVGGNIIVPIQRGEILQLQR